MRAPDLRAVLDSVSWAKQCFAAVVRSPPGSVQRRQALEELGRAVTQARILVDAQDGRLARAGWVALRVIEVGLSRFLGSPGSPGGSRGTPPGGVP